MTPQQVKDLQTQLNLQGANLKVDGIFGPLTKAAIANVGKSYTAAVANHPVIAPIVAQNGNSADVILNAYQTGDWNGLNDVTGKPFSNEDQQAAVEKATAALTPGFDAQQRFDTGNVERNLGDIKRGYDEYLQDSETSFQADKQTLDQNAANNGVLFSGGRVQKEKNLKNQYERDQASKVATTGSNLAKVGSDYQYRYGDTAVNKPSISSYFNLDTNTFNPSVATGGTTPGGLSTVYNSTGKNFQGTEVNKNKAAVQTRAASLLANKANKLTSYGYKNQF